MLSEIEVENLKLQIISLLKTIFDPELPVNIWDLGLVYAIDIDEQANLTLIMTLTSPNCPVIDILPLQIEETLQVIIPGEVIVDLVWEPAWDKSMISDEVKLDLGMI